MELAIYNTMKRFLNFIKYTKSDYQGISFNKQDGKLITNPDMKANTMNHQFRSVFLIADNMSNVDFSSSGPAAFEGF
jgi:hypothetical protein